MKTDRHERRKLAGTKEESKNTKEEILKNTKAKRDCTN